jgi:hypothetical protein
MVADESALGSLRIGAERSEIRLPEEFRFLEGTSKPLDEFLRPERENPPDLGFHDQPMRKEIKRGRIANVVYRERPALPFFE